MYDKLTVDDYSPPVQASAFAEVFADYDEAADEAVEDYYNIEVHHNQQTAARRKHVDAGQQVIFGSLLGKHQFLTTFSQGYQTKIHYDVRRNPEDKSYLKN